MTRRVTASREAIEALVARGGGARIVFARVGDRIAHRVELADAGAEGGWRGVAASIEGTSDEEWPVSPPFQELHVEERGAEGRVALLVGRAGGSHWSASIEFDGEGAEARFDIACRATRPPAWFGSQYELSAPRGGEASCVALSAECVVGARGDSVIISPEGHEGAWPRTVRWAYAWRSPAAAVAR